MSEKSNEIELESIGESPRVCKSYCNLLYLDCLL